MTRTQRWFTGSAVALVLLVGGLALLAHLLLPSDEELAKAVGARFEKVSGIGLKVGAAQWSLRPTPVVVLSDLATAQPQPVTVRRIVIRPQLSSLLRREIAIDSVEVESAVLPRASVRAFRGRVSSGDAVDALGAAWTLAAVPLQRLSVRDIVWIDRRDIALAYDADVSFDAGWRPRDAQAWRPGVEPAARLRLEREGGQDRWRASIDVGGGTWNGNAELQTLASGRVRFTARLAPQNVDIGGLVRAFGRRSVVEGKLRGETDIDAEGASLPDLVGQWHTRTRFKVQPATLTGFDLARAVRSAGTSRGGQTVLQELTGTLDTRTVDDGVVLRYTDLRARSGLLTASGSATVINRRLDGEAAVDIIDGVVGVPLKLSGTLDQPALSLTGGALAGAAVGSAILPGAGTAIGARIGQKVEELFGDGDDPKNRKAPRPAPNPKSR